MSVDQIKKIFREHIAEIKKINKKHLLIGVLIVFLGRTLNELSSYYLYLKEIKYGKFPILNDFIFNSLPYKPDYAFVYDIFALISFFIFILWIIIYKQYRKLPFFMLLFGSLYILRSVFISLTPFGNPRGFPTNGPFRGFTNYEVGVYPSGHTGSSFLCFFLIKGSLKIFAFFSFLGVLIFLLIARAHYSVDIFSAILFSYALFSFFQKNLKNWEK